jgi:hypothetical protein
MIELLNKLYGTQEETAKEKQHLYKVTASVVSDQNTPALLFRTVHAHSFLEAVGRAEDLFQLRADEKITKLDVTLFSKRSKT